MSTLSKLIIGLFIIAAILIGSFYFFSQEKSGTVMDVKVDVLLDSGGKVHITNVNGTLRDVNKVSLPKEDYIISPGVVVNVIYQKRLIGYWASVGLDPNAYRNSTTTYNLTVGLTEKPVSGNDISISARVAMGEKSLDSVMTTFKVP